MLFHVTIIYMGAPPRSSNDNPPRFRASYAPGILADFYLSFEECWSDIH